MDTRTDTVAVVVRFVGVGLGDVPGVAVEDPFCMLGLRCGVGWGPEIRALTRSNWWAYSPLEEDGEGYILWTWRRTERGAKGRFWRNFILV
jgi:hypothetical protein